MNQTVFLTLSAAVVFPMLLGATLNNARLDSGEKTITKVCVLPLEAEWSKVGVKGRSGMVREADEWSTRMQAVVLDLVGKAGAGTMLALPEGAGEAARQSVLQVARKYDSVAAQLHRKAKHVRTGRYTLGDEVALLPCSAEADALLFLHSSGSILTGGKKTFGALVGGQKFSMAMLRMAFVDARTGEVLAFTTITRRGEHFRKDPEAVYRDVLLKDFQKMRVGVPGSKAKP